MEHGFSTALSSSIVRNEEKYQSVLNDEVDSYAAMSVGEGNNNSDKIVDEVPCYGGSTA